MTPTDEPENRYRRGMTLAECVAAEGGDDEPVHGPVQAPWSGDLPPSWPRRHDDIDRLKVARWRGGAIGWCVGVLTAIAVIEVVEWVGL